MVETKLQEALANIRPDLVARGICTEYHFLKDAIQIIRKNSPDANRSGGRDNQQRRRVCLPGLETRFLREGGGEEVLVELAGSLNGEPAVCEHPEFGFGRTEARSSRSWISLWRSQ